jgi:hypothetical protein
MKKTLTDICIEIILTKKELFGGKMKNLFFIVIFLLISTLLISIQTQDEKWQKDQLIVRFHDFVTDDDVIDFTNDFSIYDLEEVKKLSNYDNNRLFSFDIKKIEFLKVKTLINNTLKQGNHKIIWQGDDANGNKTGSGVYLLKIENNNKSITKKILLLK